MTTTTIADDGNSEPNDGQLRKASGSNPTSSALPAYLIGPKKVINAVKTKSSPSNPFLTRSVYIGDDAKQGSENNPPSNAANGISQPHSGRMGYGIMDRKSPKAGVAYNAWDNVGQMHSQYRAPSRTTDLTGSMGVQNRPDARPLSSSLGKQIVPVTYSNDNPNGPDARPVASAQSGGWAKQVSLTVYIVQLEHTTNVTNIDTGHA